MFFENMFKIVEDCIVNFFKQYRVFIMFSRQNVVGLFFFCALSVAAMDLAMDHRSGYMEWLLSAPSFLIVLAFSGLTYIKREKYMLYELGYILKKDMILGGWVGFIIGCFFTFLSMSSWNIGILHGIGNSMISIIYGYILGNFAETFWPYHAES
ncbi:MAG: hypothetical protein CMF94_03665 [Candidatus Marinimicrobia bacterium]|nr:hypothetical protein [Candidatus Neomarinimicrobiota bacterium]